MRTGEKAVEQPVRAARDAERDGHRVAAAVASAKPNSGQEFPARAFQFQQTNHSRVAGKAGRRVNGANMDKLYADASTGNIMKLPERQCQYRPGSIIVGQICIGKHAKVLGRNARSIDKCAKKLVIY